MADQQDAERPSFTTFWKKSKAALTGRKITFVHDDGRPDDSSPSKDQEGPSEKERALQRRAQVRKAQIQHRERKANYVRQLELDVAKYRDMIATVERESHLLEQENEKMRSQVATVPQTVALPALSDIDVDQFLAKTVTFGMDETMQMPCYQITSPPPPQTEGSPLGNADPQGANLPAMTPEQTYQAMNFVLALEHVCWTHFQPSDFESDSDPERKESCHTMMATSLVLRNAPAEVFTTLERARADHKAKRTTPVAPFANNSTSTGTNTNTTQLPPLPPAWQASNLTLWNVYGLANSLNPPDLEVAPVQAWFELAGRYPLGLLLRADVLADLKREFVGAVHCWHFGAAMERSVFESIVGRVLTPQVVASYTGDAVGV